MKFSGVLDQITQKITESSNQALNDPARLESLAKSGLMDSERERAFDRLAHLAAKILDVPLTIISLVGDKKQFFKAGFGLPAPYDELREVPIHDSICRYTLRNTEIVAPDALEHPLLKYHPTTGPWGIGAFVAIPMQLDNGHVLGAFCAVDTKPRGWSEDDLMVLRELTASVMTEIELRIQIRELKQERELRERFVISLSHDLRNPLSIAKMGAEIMSDSDSTDEERVTLGKMITDNVDRADKMIQEILDSSRAKAGDRAAIDKSSNDVVSVIRDTVDSLSRVFKKDFHLETLESIPGAWNTDHVRRIVENLSGNAVKYGAHDQRVLIRLYRVEDGLEISVNNRGPAIPQKELDNLFGLFHRSESALSGTQAGWGIGLTVVRALTGEMGGAVRVESSDAEGTTFTVYLPHRFN